MTTPEANPADVSEQLAPAVHDPADDEAAPPDADVLLEAAEADVLEQATDAGPAEQDADEYR